MRLQTQVAPEIQKRLLLSRVEAESLKERDILCPTCKIDLANAQDIWEDKILPLTAKEHDILLDCYRTKLRYSYWVFNR